MSSHPAKKCNRLTSAGVPCQKTTANPDGWCGQCAGIPAAGSPAPTGSATAETKAAEAAGLAIDPFAESAFEEEVAALRSDWESTLAAAEALGEDLVPIADQYEVLVRYGRGVHTAVTRHGPDPDACTVLADSGDGDLALAVDVEKWEEAMRSQLPGAEAAVRDMVAAANEWLEARSDDELADLAERNGRPHFAAEDRPVRMFLLNPGVSLGHPQKIAYERRARQRWFGAGNSRYGPSGYTIDPDLQQVLAPHLRQVETPKGPLTVFDDMDGDVLAEVVDRLPRAHQWDRRKGGPTMRRLVDLAAAHPDIRFSGLVIGPGDPAREGVRVQMITIPDHKLDLPAFRDLAELDEVQVAAAGGDRTHLAWM